MPVVNGFGRAVPPAAQTEDALVGKAELPVFQADIAGRTLSDTQPATGAFFISEPLG